MKSSELITTACGALLSSFLIPSAAIPLQLTAIGAFIGYEAAYRHEEKYQRPVQNRRYQAWLEIQDHAAEYYTGAAQAHAQNRVDWATQRRNNQLNLRNSVNQKYVELFTVGRPQQLKTAQPQAEQEQPRQAVTRAQPEQVITSTQSDPVEPIEFKDSNRSILETEDIAAKIALNTTDINSARSLLLIAPPGCGKTGLLQEAMWQTSQIWAGKVDFFVFAGKSEELYCGLEADPYRYMFSGDKEYSVAAVERLERIIATRTEKFVGCPTIVLKDENNNTLRACRGFDSLDTAKPKRNIRARMVEADYSGLTKGRTKLCVEWMTSHTCRKVDTGQETSIFTMVNGVVLGRALDDGTPAYGAIQEALSGADSNRVVDDKEQREVLLKQFNEYRARLNKGEEDGSRVLCLTSIGGPWRLVLLPVYRKNIHKIELQGTQPIGPSESSRRHPGEAFNDAIRVAAERFYEKHPEGAIETEVVVDLEDGASPLQVLQRWYQAKGYSATDTELQQKYEQVSGRREVLTPEDLEELRRMLME